MCCLLLADNLIYRLILLLLNKINYVYLQMYRASRSRYIPPYPYNTDFCQTLSTVDLIELQIISFDESSFNEHCQSHMKLIIVLISLMLFIFRHSINSTICRWWGINIYISNKIIRRYICIITGHQFNVVVHFINQSYILVLLVVLRVYHIHGK